MFRRLLIFCRHSTWEPASTVCNDDKGELFHSADPHRHSTWEPASTVCNDEKGELFHSADPHKHQC